jgi:hypothetical protein
MGVEREISLLEAIGYFPGVDNSILRRQSSAATVRQPHDTSSRSPARFRTLFPAPLSAAAGEWAILAGQRGPRRRC